MLSRFRTTTAPAPPFNGSFNGTATENVKAQLATTERKIVDVEANLRAASLDGALAGDGSPEMAYAVKVGTELTALRQKRETLILAQSEAERLDSLRIAAAFERERRAK